MPASKHVEIRSSDGSYLHYHLRDGDRVTATLYHCDKDIILEGKITIEKDQVFICQNTLSGFECEDRKGYKYSWSLGSGAVSSSMGVFLYCKDLKILDTIPWEEFVRV